MNTEYELRILEIDKDEIIKKLESLGATKVADFDQKRYVYDLIPKQENKWIRLRNNGFETTLTLKNIEKNSIDGTKEIEFKVSDFEKTNEFLEGIGFKSKGYQENKRTRYMLDNVEIDIDSWPMIPTYLEIEGSSEEEVKSTLEKLSLENPKITTLNCSDIYKDIYGIDIEDYKILKF